jgi:signal transduction histidine kinase
MSDQDQQPHPAPRADAQPLTRPRTLRAVGRRTAGPFLGGMRVRKKVLFLHTLFWLGLALVLMVPLRPAIMEVVEQAEIDQARMVLRLVQRDLAAQRQGQATAQPPPRPPPLWSLAAPDATVRSGSPQELGLTPAAEAQARASPGRPVSATLTGRQAAALMFIPGPSEAEGDFWAATVTIPEARRAVFQLYILTAAALLAIYALVAAALELFVLPQHVYGPIGRMLDADRAVQEGDKEHELIPESVIATDELGEIMRSRNNSIIALRRHEKALAEALAELERVATDLKRKNHLLEAVRCKLADADRLASLGMMSAGIAHELNTPLAVLKGLVEKLNHQPESLDALQAALMLRVVQRLERLGESLLDFARVRPPHTQPVVLAPLVDEAVTLVHLDRRGSIAQFNNHISQQIMIECDPDRMVQVLVNLLRNAADAVRASAERRPGMPGATARDDESPLPTREPGTVDIAAVVSEREGHEWVSITVSDTGPGIDPDLLSRLFEPFVSTRLDAHGTGLGLAVAEGIVREHGGLILARNREDGRGAVFEIMLPVHAAPYAGGAGAMPVDFAPSAASDPAAFRLHEEPEPLPQSPLPPQSTDP